MMAYPVHRASASGAVTDNATLTTNYPAGTVSGDLLIMFVVSMRTAAGAYTLSTPAGWTVLETQSSSGPSDTKEMVTYWRWAGSETNATVVASLGSTNMIRSSITAFDGSSIDPSSPVGASASIYDNAQSATVTAPSVATTKDESYLYTAAAGARNASTGAWTFSWANGTEVHEVGAVWSGGSPNPNTYRTISVAVREVPTATGSVNNVATATQSSILGRFGVSVVVHSKPSVPPGIDVGPTFTDAATRIIDVPAPGPEEVGSSTGTGTGTDLTITYPSGSVSGDYVVAAAHFYKTSGSTAPTITTPTGWTLLRTQTAGGTDPYVVALYGRFRGAETSVTFVANTGTSVQSLGSVYAYRNVDAGVPVSESAISYGLETDDLYAVPGLTTPSSNNRIWKGYISNGQYQSEPGALWTSSTEVADMAVTIDATRRVNLSTALGFRATAGAVGAENVTQIAPLVAITPLGMSKSGSQALGGNGSTTKVTGWTPQGGTASGDIVDNDLVVNGSGNITVSVSGVTYSGSMSGGLRIHLNGTQVATTTSTTTLSWTGDVVHGDKLSLHVYKTTTFSRNITGGSLAYTVNQSGGDWQLLGSDDFDGTGPLSSNWTTDGGGTLKRTSGELDGTGTPSVPISFAWWNTPAASGKMRVECKLRWNGRNPLHSSVAPVVRADPFQNPLVNPGAEHGVMAASGADFEALYYEDYDQSESGGFTGLKWVTGSGGFSRPITKYAENALLELESDGSTYTYKVAGVTRKSGTVSTGIIPESYRYVGLMIQDDSAESGGGQPPAMLDEFRAYHWVYPASGAAHTFGWSVALQVPQNIQLESNDAADVVATETHTIAATQTRGDVDPLAGTEAQALAQPAADPYDITGTESQSTVAAQTVADTKDLVATETVTGQAAAVAGVDAHDLVATETEVVSNTVVGADAASGFWKDTNSATVETTGADAGIGWTDRAVPAGTETVGVADSNTGIAVGSTSDTYDLVATENAAASNTVPSTDAVTFPGDNPGTISPATTGENVGVTDAITSRTAAIPAADAKDIIATEAQSLAQPAADPIDLAGTEGNRIDQAATDAKDIVATEAGSIINLWSVADAVDTEDKHVQVGVAGATDLSDVSFSEVAFRSSAGILSVPRLHTVYSEDRTLVVERESREIDTPAEIRRLMIGNEY